MLSFRNIFGAAARFLYLVLSLVSLPGAGLVQNAAILLQEEMQLVAFACERR